MKIEKADIEFRGTALCRSSKKLDVETRDRWAEGLVRAFPQARVAIILDPTFTLEMIEDESLKSVGLMRIPKEK